jgi:putative transposase
MKRARFTEEQIIGALKEHEAGAKTADLGAQARRLGSDALQLEGQVWRMDVPEAKRLKQLEDENAN